MTKFRFKLQKVLEYRESLQKDAKDLYLAARKRTLDAEREKRNIAHRRETVLGSSPNSLDHHVALDAYITRLDDLEREQEVLIAILLQEEERAKEAWIDRKRDVEALAQLKETALDEWNVAAAREEQNALDEWAVQRRKAA
jgi:flagellar FliJ protein